MCSDPAAAHRDVCKKYAPATRQKPPEAAPKNAPSVPAPLTELQIRAVVRQEIKESGVTSGLQPLLDMTPDQALVISTATALLWATAWCFKQVAKFIKDDRDETSG